MKEEHVKKENKRNQKRHYEYYFLSCVFLLYIILLLFDPGKILQALIISGKLLIQLIPIMVLVILFMIGVNYFINPKQVKKYVGQESGLKGWLIVAGAGILSHGSIYVWYPLLRDLREHGMRSSLVAVFLYNRAIKIPFLPIMIYYFGLTFVILLSLYMIIAAFVEGQIIQMVDR